MIGHRTIGPYLYGCLGHLLGQQFAIDVLATVFEEDRFSSDAARGDVM